MYNDGGTQQKQEANAWQQDTGTYNFSLDMSTTVPQTIYEVDQSGSLGSLPQAYVPIDTMTPHGTDWWPKGPAEQKTCTWDKNTSLAPPIAKQTQPSSSPSQRTDNAPTNWLPPTWQNHPPCVEKDKKGTDRGSSHAVDNSTKISFQESVYQQSIFQCDYQQLPSQQQHHPETVVEEASSEEPQ